MKLRLATVLAPCVLLALASAAAAVIIDSGNGTGNTSAPAPDPGWDDVGTCNGYSCVYLGNGWVLTANHVGAGDAMFFGATTYPWLPGTDVRLHNPDTSPADLILFRLQTPYPPLPALSISSVAPALGTPLILIGHGRDRGAATSWDPSPGPPPSSIDGYLWAPSAAMRWGTNFAEDVNAAFFEPYFGTQLFGTIFDQSGSGHSIHEAQGAVGDSGGAVFASNGSSYDLAGTMIGLATYDGQPAETALYGNFTLAADLSVYRDEILSMPEPAGGLSAGAVLVAALARVRFSAGTRRACRGTARAASSPPRA